jgi:hypothetical protein
MNEMWKREEFLIANGMSQLPNASMTNDLSPYDYFDGGLDTDIDMDFSEARGRKKRLLRQFNSPQRRRAREKRRTQRIQTRQTKQRSKQSQAVAQNDAIKKISKSAETDSQLLAQLNASKTPIVEPKPTMSKGTKTGLIIGSIAVAGIIGFVLYKKFKKK